MTHATPFIAPIYPSCLRRPATPQSRRARGIVLAAVHDRPAPKNPGPA